MTLVEDTDDLNLVASAYGALGAVLAAADDVAGARAAYDRAVELFERKGNITSAARARELARDPILRT